MFQKYCALNEAGADFRNVVRVTYILPEAADFPRWPTFRKYLLRETCRNDDFCRAVRSAHAYRNPGNGPPWLRELKFGNKLITGYSRKSFQVEPD